MIQQDARSRYEISAAQVTELLSTTSLIQLKSILPFDTSLSWTLNRRYIWIDKCQCRIMHTLFCIRAWISINYIGWSKSIILYVIDRTAKKETANCWIEAGQEDGGSVLRIFFIITSLLPRCCNFIVTYLLVFLQIQPSAAVRHARKGARHLLEFLDDSIRDVDGVAGLSLTPIECLLMFRLSQDRLTSMLMFIISGSINSSVDVSYLGID